MLGLHTALIMAGRKRKRKAISACLVDAAVCKTTPPAAARESKRQRAKSASSSSSSSILWTKPVEGRLKLNFDGSVGSPESNSSSVGGVYRDHVGKFVLGYAEPIEKATSSVAELVALKRGLDLALENGWRDVAIEGDYKMAVDFMESRVRVRAKNDMEQCTEIAALRTRLGKTTVSHVLREGNKVADRFAKLGGKAAAQRVWRDEPPDEVLQFLERDAIGK
jgi:ribonuclease HI